MTETLGAILPDALEQDVAALLERACRLKLTIATAESCTGGLFSSLLTDVEGASHAFDRAFVVYSNAAKEQMLGVPSEVIARHGSVSRPVALAMAEGALRFSQADIALAVTGFAGAAGEGDEVGLVHFACARRGWPTRHREEHFGDIGRGAVRLACLAVLLEMAGEVI